jgi:hypothetical protein
MKRTFLTFFILSAAPLAMLAIALYVPSVLPTNSDFSALYFTDLALVNRVPIYDLPRVEALAQASSGISAEHFFLARFPYPPWYALSTFYLGLLPAQAAATLWFEINLLMLFLSVWLLTEGWSGRLRLIAFPLSLFFLPVLGALSVGQYSFPVLLGASLLIYSLRKGNGSLAALGVVLLTFKPHLGALILVSALVWLIYRRGDFEKRVLRLVLIAAALLSILGLLADPAWVASYPRMLLNYQNEGNVSACSECASLPVWLSRWLFDGSLALAAGIAVLLLILLAAVTFLNRRALLASPMLLLASAVLVTLLVSPYLYNYDFLLLLVPFAVLVRRAKPDRIVIVFLCYLIPTIALLVWGRLGNIALLPVTMVLTALMLIDLRKPVIDVPVLEA